MIADHFSRGDHLLRRQGKTGRGQGRRRFHQFALVGGEFERFRRLNGEGIGIVGCRHELPDEILRRRGFASGTIFRKFLIQAVRGIGVPKTPKNGGNEKSVKAASPEGSEGFPRRWGGDGLHAKNIRFRSWRSEM